MAESDNETRVPTTVSDAAAMRRVTVFSVFHNNSPMPAVQKDATWIMPIQAGSLPNGRIGGMWHDDDGDNLSKYNSRINELTAHYWVYKHIDKFPSDYIGFCHYRRTPEMSIRDMLDLCSDTVYSVSTTFAETIREQYAAGHVGKDLDTFVNAFNETAMDGEYNDLDEYLGTHTMRLYNMYIMGTHNFLRMWELMEKCVRLGLSLVESGAIDLSNRNSYQSRVPGFILERMTSYWIWHEAKRGRITERQMRVIHE